VCATSKAKACATGGKLNEKTVSKIFSELEELFRK
jgi:hypothetical protein